MTLKLAYWDNPFLRKKAKTVEKFDDEFKDYIRDFLIRFQDPKLFGPNSIPIGLAATQIHSDLRYFAICPYEEVNGKPTYGPPEIFINPVLTEPSNELVTEDEGCLSFPGLYLPVERPLSITAEWQDIDGKTHKKRFSGYLARQIMHENDHLNGVLFIDRISKNLRKRVKTQLDRIKKKYAKNS